MLRLEELNNNQQQQQQQQQNSQQSTSQNNDPDQIWQNKYGSILNSPLTPFPRPFQKLGSQKFRSKTTNQVIQNEDQEKLYYGSYKKINHILDQNKIYKSNNDLYTSMLKTTIGPDKLLPRKLGLIKETGTFKQMNINSQYIGNRYTNMLSEVLKHEEFSNLEHFSAQKNNLNSSNLKEIVNSLSKHVTQLDLSKNNIGPIGCKYLETIFDSRNYRIQHLNLENNGLGDQGVLILVKMFEKNSSITVLNLSLNRLTYISMKDLSTLISNSQYLQELYLYWNQINSEGCLQLAQGLTTNNTLAVLDLSHNSLGSNQYLLCGRFLIRSITRSDSQMRHLDISYNNFTLFECKAIQSEISSNQTLFGIHIEGNSYCNIDPRGFINILDEGQFDLFQKRNHFGKRRIKGVQKVEEQPKNNQQYAQAQAIKKYAFQDNCWICQGWVEYTFKYNIKKSGQIKKEPIYLHMDFEDYKPVLLDQNDHDPQMFSVTRMIPKGQQIFYFFTNPEEDLICLNALQKLQDYQPQTNLITKQDTPPHLSMIEITYQCGTKKKYTVPLLFNKLLPILNMNKQLINRDYEPNIQTAPRDNGTMYFIKSPENEWSIPKSLFKDYIVENDEITKKCFEYDWSCSKLNKIIRNEEDQQKVKDLLLSKYREIKSVYKYYASIGVVGDVFSIPTNTFSEFLSTMPKVVDGQKLKLRDVDLSFVATNTVMEKNPLNPDRALVRYQFMEMILRMAGDKYMKTGECKFFIQGLFHIIADGLNKVIQNAEDYQQWRNQRYWNMECDHTLKKKLDLLKFLYNKFAGSHQSSKKKYTSSKYLNLQEFKEIWNKYDIYDDLFVDRDVSICYNSAMMTQIDEIHQERHMQMYFTEFLEGLARVAEKLSPTPLGENPDVWNETRRILQPLFKKLETVLNLLQFLCDSEMKEQQKKQEKLKQQEGKATIQDLIQTQMRVDTSNLENVQLQALKYIQNKKRGNIDNIEAQKLFKKIFFRGDKPEEIIENKDDAIANPKKIQKKHKKKKKNNLIDEDQDNSEKSSSFGSSSSNPSSQDDNKIDEEYCQYLKQELQDIDKQIEQDMKNAMKNSVNRLSTFLSGSVGDIKKLRKMSIINKDLNRKKSMIQLQQNTELVYKSMSKQMRQNLNNNGIELYYSSMGPMGNPQQNKLKKFDSSGNLNLSNNNLNLNTSRDLFVVDEKDPVNKKLSKDSLDKLNTSIQHSDQSNDKEEQ